MSSSHWGQIKANEDELEAWKSLGSVESLEKASAWQQPPDTIETAMEEWAGEHPAHAAIVSEWRNVPFRSRRDL